LYNIYFNYHYFLFKKHVGSKKNLFIYKQEKKNVSLKFKFLSIKKHVGNKKIHVFFKYINKKKSLSKIQILIFLINIIITKIKIHFKIIIPKKYDVLFTVGHLLLVSKGISKQI